MDTAAHSLVWWKDQQATWPSTSTAHSFPNQALIAYLTFWKSFLGVLITPIYSTERFEILNGSTTYIKCNCLHDLALNYHSRLCHCLDKLNLNQKQVITSPPHALHSIFPANSPQFCSDVFPSRIPPMWCWEYHPSFKVWVHSHFLLAPHSWNNTLNCITFQFKEHPYTLFWQQPLWGFYKLSPSALQRSLQPMIDQGIQM